MILPENCKVKEIIILCHLFAIKTPDFEITTSMCFAIMHAGFVTV